MEGTNPLTMIEWLSPYIWHAHKNGYGSQHSYLTWKEPILSPWQNGSTLTYDFLIRMAYGLVTSPWKGPRSREHQASPWSARTSLWLVASSTHQLSDHVGTNPTVISEWLSTHIWHGRNLNPLTMTEWISPYIWPWKELNPLPCQNGSRSHHFPLEGT